MFYFSKKISIFSSTYLAIRLKPLYALDLRGHVRDSHSIRLHSSSAFAPVHVIGPVHLTLRMRGETCLLCWTTANRLCGQLQLIKLSTSEKN